MSLYKKNSLSAYDQNYTIVDLGNYLTSNTFERFDENVYYAFKEFDKNNKLNLNLDTIRDIKANKKSATAAIFLQIIITSLFLFQETQQIVRIHAHRAQEIGQGHLTLRERHGHRTATTLQIQMNPEVRQVALAHLAQHGEQRQRVADLDRPEGLKDLAFGTLRHLNTLLEAHRADAVIEVIELGHSILQMEVVGRLVHDSKINLHARKARRAHILDTLELHFAAHLAHRVRAGAERQHTEGCQQQGKVFFHRLTIIF